MQNEMKSSNLSDEDMQNKKKSNKKSIMQSIMEDKITHDKDLPLVDQVDEWMKLQQNNVNI